MPKQQKNSEGANWKGLVRPMMPKPFVSKTILKVLRITMKSVIDLVELLHKIR